MQLFINVSQMFIHFDFSFKGKLENEPRFESDLVLNFAMCSFINLRDRIHDKIQY